MKFILIYAIVLTGQTAPERVGREVFSMQECMDRAQQYLTSTLPEVDGKTVLGIGAECIIVYNGERKA